MSSSLSSSLSVSGAAPLVGRARELGALEAALDEALAGRGGVWFLAGDAGIGKSRLAEEVAARAVAQSLRVIWGRSWEAGGAPAYWPWIQVLRQLVDDDEGRALLEASSARAAALAHLLPEIVNPSAEAPASTLEGEAGRFRLLEAAAGLVWAAARRRPTLLLLEDLHAADPSSLALLELVAGAIRSHALVVLGTFREADAQRTGASGLLARIARQAKTITLANLARADVTAFLLATLGEPAPPPLVEALVATTEGHPLFLVESTRLLGTQGLDVHRTDALVPATVRAAIRERLGTLPPPCRELLGAAAVIGREFGRDTLAAMGAGVLPALAATLAEAVDAAVIQEGAPGQYRFAHILIRDEAYGALAPEHREALHLALARTLEARASQVDERHSSEVLHHYVAAGTRGRAGVPAAALRAARVALASFAYEEAARQLELGLGALDGDDGSERMRIELLLERGRALELAGEVGAGQASCEEAADAAARLGAPELLARAALAYGTVSVLVEVDARLVSLLRRALAALPEADGGVRALVMARLATALQPSPSDEPRELARAAIAMARRLGDPRARLAVLRPAIGALMDVTPAEERTLLAREHLALATSLREPHDELVAWSRLVFCEYERGNVRASEEAIEACARLAERIGHPGVRWRVEAFRAMRALREGRFADAERHAEEARRLGEEARDPNVTRSLLLQRIGALQLAGCADDALALLPQLERSFAGDSMGRTFSQLFHASALLRAGHANRACELLTEDVVGPSLRFGDRSSLEMLAELALARRDGVLADRIVAGLSPRPGELVSGGLSCLTWDGPVERSLGLLAWAKGERDQARAHLERAHEQASRTGGRVHAAWAARDLALLAAESAPSTQPASPRATPTFRLLRDGELWLLEHAGRRFHLRDGKGVRWLDRLVSEPGRERHVLDLIGAEEGGVVDLGDSGALLDEDARAAYGQRVEELRDLLNEAEANGDLGRAAKARAELDAIAGELARAVGLGGRERRTGAAAERARVNVQRRLRDAIARIAEQDAELGRHLERSVRTGTFCVYDP